MITLLYHKSEGDEMINNIEIEYKLLVSKVKIENEVKQIEISNDDAIRTIIVSKGIIANIKLKAILDGNIDISGFDNILNNFLKYPFIFFFIVAPYYIFSFACLIDNVASLIASSIVFISSSIML